MIQNMAGDGNYGIYSTMEGLSQAMIECTMDVNMFREEMYNYILNNKSSILTNIFLPIEEKNQGSWEEWHEMTTLIQILCNELGADTLTLKDHIYEKYWVDLSLHLPVFVIMYHTHFFGLM